MKFEKEIKELEDKLEALKVAASADELPNHKIIEVLVSEKSRLFADLRSTSVFRSVDDTYYLVSLRLFEPTEKTYTFDEAKKYISDHGVRLMTKDEIHYLIAVGVLREGDTSFWSSSVFSNYRSNAWQFDGSDGTVEYNSRNYPYAVRCVRRV
jgi:hypothetical protein